MFFLIKQQISCQLVNIALIWVFVMMRMVANKEAMTKCHSLPMRFGAFILLMNMLLICYTFSL